MRRQVLEKCFEFDGIDLRKGTERILAAGVSVKASFGIDRKFTDLDKVDALLDRMKADPEGAVIEARLVKVKYELVESEYQKLPANWKSEIDQVIVSKPSSPQVEVEIKK